MEPNRVLAFPCRQPFWFVVIKIVNKNNRRIGRNIKLAVGVSVGACLLGMNE